MDSRMVSAFRHSGCQATSKSFVKLIGKVTGQVRRAIETSEEEARGWGTWTVVFLDVPAKGGGGRGRPMDGTLGGRESGKHVDGSRKA